MTKIEEKKYWVDTFAGCIVTKKEKYAPPERYFEAVRGTLDIYVDTFALGNGCLIDFAWTKEQQPYWNKLLHKHFEIHKVNLQTTRLIRRTYPPKVFDELLEKMRYD